MAEQAQHSEIRSQILSADTVNSERFSKSTTNPTWLETVQGTHLDAACSPVRGCSSEASLYTGVDVAARYAESFAGAVLDRTKAMLDSRAPSDLQGIVDELTWSAGSDDARIRILAFEIQQLRARSNR